ncbi:serine hydrolase domain-containing protein [Paractinoplanes brasiliensis]|uniref:CubicO group peptidase (Beta-lactamase class C family) n=1 Tax=Paractinoplanes brasiliensis TaxID=52695 RepID=A0A4R6JXP2_9ACTN|nr:serine hydrolase domain-containing protein [Actinoplanes brasiliensis]TDO40461.1 CubicO group peptidase (beta-lactamase class C family) [Actinoplanes brasiliensis]
MSSQLRQAMAARVERGEFPGLLALGARGDDVLVETAGVTEFGGDVPLRRDTPFRITSMTKPVLAAVTLMLAEDDVLDLEQPVARFLPELAGQRVLARPDAPLDQTLDPVRPVTVEDLLTFTLGFGNVLGPDGGVDPPCPIVRAWRDLGLQLAEPEPRCTLEPDEWIRRFGSLPLIHQPGEKWMYNTGTLVLGVLLARAAGRPLGDLLHERLFAPLGMTSTGFWLPAERIAQVPPHYLGDDSGRPVRQTGDSAESWSRPPVFPSGSGGLLSTADDYLAFARMLLHGGVHGGTRLLSERSVAAMTTNHLTSELIDSGGFFLGGAGWGYGLAVTVRDDEISGPGRYGWSGGYGTSWFTDPREGLIFIVLSQVTDLLWNGALTELSKLAYGSVRPGEA